MNTVGMALIFDAVGHPTRLETLLLLSAEPDGIPAGEIARRLDVVQNTISPHLKKLADAGLVEISRSGRTLSYRLNRTALVAAGKVLTDL